MFLALTTLLLTGPLQTFQAPAGKLQANVTPELSVLPNGRLVTARGRRLYGGENCWNTLYSPDAKSLVLLYEGGFNVFTDLDAAKPTVKKFARKDFGFCAAFLDDRRLLVSNGEAGGLQIVDLSTSDKTDISANVDGVTGTYITDLVLSDDKKFCYALDVAGQDLLTFDLTLNKLVNRVKAGREPYAIALDEATKQVFVANIGLFDYTPIPKTDDPNFFANGITRPAFPFPSPEAEKGVQFEGRFVKGLGDARTPDAHSVFAYSLATPAKPQKTKAEKTGLLIHAPSQAGKAVGGSAPCALLVKNGHLYVSNSNNDTVQSFSVNGLKLEKTIKLAPTPELSAYRGVIPNGMSTDSDGKTLFVCESGLNAVAAIDTASGKVLYHVPTGWWPNMVRVSPDGKSLTVACQKGIGRGPQGPKSTRLPSDERYGMTAMPGMAHLVSLPATKPDQAAATLQVVKNNGLSPVAADTTPNPIPTVPGKPSEDIKYVVFITKENHTFDGIFGTLEGSDGEPSYAEWGEKGWVRERNNKEERFPIMPNHLKLARQFSVSDNFYMEPQASGDGHRWLIGVYPSVWTTKVFYSGWNMSGDPKTPGRFTQFGSNGSQIPEDYLENGSMWEHLSRGGITFRNYGEGFEFPGVDEAYETTKSGAIEPLNFPINKVLWDNTCWDFPIYNNNIPDIARFEWFKEDLEKNFRQKGKPIPHFMNITYCNDHGTGPRPADGYPYTSSYMADNDLALGKTLEYLSSLPEWKNMAVFVTQDDSGGDNDHVDRHRSFVLALGPWTKKGYVSHDHTSIMSIIKTVYRIFGLGPNNLFDATATDLRDMFTKTPDFKPYKAVDTHPTVFVASKAFDPKDPNMKKRRFMKPTVAMDDPKWIEKMRPKDD